MNAIKAKKIMSTKLITVDVNTPLSTAYSLLLANNIRHLPVTNPVGDVIGVISERDFGPAILPGAPSNFFNPLAPVFQPGAQAGDYMNPRIYSVSVDAEINDAISSMLQTKTSSCLVEKSGEIIGIITSEDLLRLCQDYLSQPKGGLRAKIENFVMTSPLGTIAHLFSSVGI